MIQNTTTTQTEVLLANAKLARSYLTWLKDRRGRVPLTIKNYRDLLDKYLVFVGETPLDEVSLKRMEMFVGRPRRSKQPGAAATQAKDAAIIRAFYAYCVNAGHMERNRAALLGSPAVRNRNPRPIPDADFERLWAAAEGEERMVLGLGMFLGLRRQEIVDLRPSHVDVTRQMLTGFVRKGGGDDIMPYGDTCGVFTRLGLPGAERFPAMLSSYHEARMEQRWLLTIRNPDNLNYMLTKLSERAEVTHYTPHQMRHSFVTNLLRAHVPLYLVTKLANHSSPTVTNRYIKASATELGDWLASTEGGE